MRLEEIGAVEAPSGREAVRAVVDAYAADDELDRIATEWPPTTGEVYVEDLHRPVDYKLDWCVDDRVDVWPTPYAATDD